jgi:hypothetical protein
MLDRLVSFWDRWLPAGIFLPFLASFSRFR